RTRRLSAPASAGKTRYKRLAAAWSRVDRRARDCGKRAVAVAADHGTAAIAPVVLARAAAIALLCQSHGHDEVGERNAAAINAQVSRSAVEPEVALVDHAKQLPEKCDFDEVDLAAVEKCAAGSA